MSEATKHQQEVEKQGTTPSIFIEETTEERVEALGQMVKEIDNDYANLSKRLSEEMTEFQDRLKNKVEGESSELRKGFDEALAKLQEKFYEKVHEEIRKVTTDEIAESLTKKVLVTRPATREESRNPDTLKIRQATHAEIRQN